MTPCTWKLTKIRHFNFLHLSWTLVHENPQKSVYSISMTPVGYMKILKNQTIQFSSTFMTQYMKIHKNHNQNQSVWFFVKIESSDFCWFSCTRGHKNWRKLNRLIFKDFHVPGYMKIHKNHTLQFSWKLNKIKMSDFLWKLNLLIFVDFYVPPGSWKLRKIKASDFCEISCTQGHFT